MILQNDFKRQWEFVEETVLRAVRRVGASGWYILGKEVEAFEKELAAFWGVAHAIGTANGLDALEIGLRCVGLQPGDKVLTTPLSAFATTLAIVRAGGVPVFVDVDRTGGVDLAQGRDLLAGDKSIRFLLPVHLYGRALNMKELKRLQRDFQLQIVEDCAQAIGAGSGGVPVGTVGQAAATSFYPTKNLGALGDAGAVLTNDASIARTAMEMRNYGQSAHYVHSQPGLNSRLDELHAAILREAFLPNLPTWTTARRRIAAKLLDEIRNPALSLPAFGSAHDSVWHLFPVLVSAGSRDEFQAHLQSRGVTTGVHYPRIIPDQPALTNARLPDYSTGLENARRFARTEISLPVHPFMT
ncbi:MAG TPA: DegT/DnrJ/EryC1/StrS family aminotransferase, partial [Chthoniobacterales bacterium]|nr:DegT/DnrJ/EryC1/StrS family aminotransferase [Chthoniobacterales bacterium]